MGLQKQKYQNKIQFYFSIFVNQNTINNKKHLSRSQSKIQFSIVGFSRVYLFGFYFFINTNYEKISYLFKRLEDFS